MNDPHLPEGPDAPRGGSPLGSAAFVLVCAVGGFLLWRLVAGLLGGPC